MRKFNEKEKRFLLALRFLFKDHKVYLSRQDEFIGGDKHCTTTYVFKSNTEDINIPLNEVVDDL